MIRNCRRMSSLCIMIPDRIGTGRISHKAVEFLISVKTIATSPMGASGSSSRASLESPTMVSPLRRVLRELGKSWLSSCESSFAIDKLVPLKRLLPRLRSSEMPMTITMILSLAP